MTSTTDTSVFRVVIDNLQERLGISVQDLSMRTNYSTSAISLLKTGQRKLTEDFAAAMARAMGGSKDAWLQIYRESTSDQRESADHYLGMIAGSRPAVGVKLSQGLKRLVNHEIYNLFAEDGDRSAFKPLLDMEDKESGGVCHIMNFEPSRIQFTSYDTRIGGIVPVTGDSFEVDMAGYVPNGGAVVLEPFDPKQKSKNSAILVSAEHFELPWFLETEVHPAHTLSLKVAVGNGPIIDPHFNGYLCVRVTNPWPVPVTISPTEAFLTVRFSVLTALPLTDLSMEDVFGVLRYNDPNRAGKNVEAVKTPTSKPK